MLMTPSLVITLLLLFNQNSEAKSVKTLKASEMLEKQNFECIVPIEPLPCKLSLVCDLMIAFNEA